jgi:hypothetical protein
VKLTPRQVSSRLGAKGVRDVLVDRAPSGRVSRVALTTPKGKRTILAQDFRAELELRSTWFTVRVLNLVPPARRVPRGKPAQLHGFVRGLSGVRLQQRVAGGAWRTVRPVKTRANGRFTTTVTPAATTAYRLASPAGTGAVVTLKTR